MALKETQLFETSLFNAVILECFRYLTAAFNTALDIRSEKLPMFWNSGIIKDITILLRRSTILLLFIAMFLFSKSVIVYLVLGLSENNCFMVFQSFLLTVIYFPFSMAQKFLFAFCNKRHTIISVLFVKIHSVVLCFKYLLHSCVRFFIYKCTIISPYCMFLRGVYFFIVSTQM